MSCDSAFASHHLVSVQCHCSCPSVQTEKCARYFVTTLSLRFLTTPAGGSLHRIQAKNGKRIDVCPVPQRFVSRPPGTTRNQTAPISVPGFKRLKSSLGSSMRCAERGAHYKCRILCYLGREPQSQRKRCVSKERFPHSIEPAESWAESGYNLLCENLFTELGITSVPLELDRFFCTRNSQD